MRHIQTIDINPSFGKTVHICARMKPTVGNKVPSPSEYNITPSYKVQGMQW